MLPVVGTRSPTLLPLLRSQVQGDMLALLYLQPEREYSLSEAAAIIGASVRAVQTEAERLIGTGFLTDRRRGKLRLIRAVTDSVISRPLTDLLAVTYGPLPILSGLLQSVPDVEQAYIYGSWAARYQGEPGPIPADVDVLVVGSPTLDDLDDVADQAQKKLRRPVNIRRIRREGWHDPDPDPADPFLASVRSRPLVALKSPEAVNDDDLAQEQS
jgi:predicted nucleotidyltransferase